MSFDATDELASVELVARYNQAIDGRDAQAWAGMFVEGGVFQVIGQEPVTGREALVAMVEGMDPTSGERHWTTNFVIEGDGGAARMTVALALLRGSNVLGTGRYADVLAREEAGWRFVRSEVALG